MATNRFRTALFALIIFAAQSATLLHAEPLSDSEKDLKRKELDAYFVDALLRTQTAQTKPVHQVFRATANASIFTGYDSNVDLADDKDGDMFYQPRVHTRLEYAPENAALFGHPISFGADGDYSFLGYFDRSDLDHHMLAVSPFTRIEMCQNLWGEAAYEFRLRDYDAPLSHLSYLSNGARGSLTHQITPGLSQKATFRYGALHYDGRNALLADATFTGDNRLDNRYEGIYLLRYRTGNWSFSAEGSWVWNDSNDEYFDYNDYEDAGVDGTISYRATSRLALSLFGGWHKRMYDERKFGRTFDDTQDDDWYFMGTRAFYALNKWSGVDVSFTFYKNDSNDDSRDYDSIITGIGYHLYF